MRARLALFALTLSACHDWYALSTSWEGEGVCTAYVVAGPSHTCARMTNGTMYCWGDNRFGQLGVGDVSPKKVPTRLNVFANVGVTRIYLPTGDGELSSDQGVFSCAISTDNVLWCWGGNRFGQLGVGDFEPRSSPTRVMGLTGEVSRASNGGGHTCAQLTDGSVWCWGKNTSGQLGTGDQSPSLAPRAVQLGGAVERIATGNNFACARGVDGRVSCWGENGTGQLGLGDSMARSSPTQVSALGMNALRLAAGGSHGCSLANDGLVSCWGDNRFGQLGVGDTMPRTTPQVLTSLGPVSQVFTGGSHTCALKLDSTLWCWGDNRSGQLGLGDTTPRLVPTQVSADTLGTQVAAASAGGAHTCAVKTDGSVWCWGDNRYGQLAGETGPSSAIPAPVFPTCP